MQFQGFTQISEYVVNAVPEKAEIVISHIYISKGSAIRAYGEQRST